MLYIVLKTQDVLAISNGLPRVNLDGSALGKVDGEVQAMQR